jgi:hypothetical protein
MTDTDGIFVRVENGRQGNISCRTFNGEITGVFVSKRFPLGGGVTTTVVAFLVSSDCEDLPIGLKILPKSRGRKNTPLENSAGRQGSIVASSSAYSQIRPHRYFAGNSQF